MSNNFLLARSRQLPPTKPGWYYAKIRGRDPIMPVFVDTDYDYPGLCVQWGPLLLRIDESTWFGPVPEVVEVSDGVS